MNTAEIEIEIIGFEGRTQKKERLTAQLDECLAYRDINNSNIRLLRKEINKLNK